MAEANQEQTWSQLETWLAEARAQARARQEALPAELDTWADMAQAALSGDQAALAAHLSELLPANSDAPDDAPRADLVDVATAQFDAVICFLGASDPPPDPCLWQSLMACQTAIMAKAARLTSLPGLPPAPQLHALIEFSREIAGILDPETLVDKVLSLMYQSFGYQYVHLFLMDAGGQQIVHRGGLWHGQPAEVGDEGVLRVGEEGIIGWVAAQGEPAIVADVTSDARYKPHPGLPDLQSEIVVPLILGEQVLGVLDVSSDQSGTFGEADLFLLQGLADLVAIALENARLHLNMQRRLQEQTILFETSAAVSTNLDADTVLRTIAAKLTQAVGAGGCVISQWSPESHAVSPVAEYIVERDPIPSRTWRTEGESISLGDDLVASQVLQTHRPVLLYAEAGEETPLGSPSWSSPGWKTLLALPVQLENVIIGLVELYDHRASRRFTPDQIRLCQTLAHQTAFAMERIRLFNETWQRLKEVSELYSLANEIATNLNLDEVLDAIVRVIQRTLGCRGCCIFLLDEENQTLEIKAAVGLKRQWRDAARLRLGEGVAGRAAAEARSVYQPDTARDPDYVFFDEEVRSLLAVPLQVKRGVIGVINIDERLPDAFGADQERLLTITAAQAAIAIENARLFSEVLSEQRRTEVIIRYMADGLLMLDRHDVVVSCNPALAMMLGMQRQEILGQRATDPDADPGLRAICEPATVKERTGVLAHEVDIPRTGSGGETLRPRTLRIFSTTVSDEAGKRVGEIRVAHDVTKDRELEEMKDEFFSMISHEMRTPLFSIQGFVRLLLEGQVPDEDTEREFLDIIGRQAEQLAQLVNNILNISRLEAGMFELRHEPVQLLDVLEEIVYKLRSIAQGKNVALETDWPDSLPFVTGDRDWLGQVLTNLIGNAIKFTPEGGRVVVGAQQSNAEVVVEVSDTGIGIPAESLDQIFTKFYRVPDQGDTRPVGTGLGLHISRRIVEAHGGRIWAESTKGEGSNFRLALPCGEKNGVHSR